MNETPDSTTPAPPAADAETAAVWADWITLWQSEWAAMAADREMQEAVQRGVDLWAAGALSAHDAGRRAEAAPPAGPAPAMAAPDWPNAAAGGRA